MEYAYYLDSPAENVTLTGYCWENDTQSAIKIFIKYTNQGSKWTYAEAPIPKSCSLQVFFKLIW